MDEAKFVKLSNLNKNKHVFYTLLVLPLLKNSVHMLTDANFR